MGIQRKVRASGKVFYYARLWHEGQELVEGGFTTRPAAERALAAMRRRLESERIGEPTPVAPANPTILELFGDPFDPEGPAPGTYLHHMSRPGAARESYVLALRTAARALMPFWKDRCVSEVTSDLLAEYQRFRLGQNSQRGAHWKTKTGDKAPARTAGRKKIAVGPVPIAASTCNRELVVLRGALTWAADPARDPSRRIRPVAWPRRIRLDEGERRSPVMLSEDEARLMRECSPQWLADLVLLLRFTGMRSGEALGLVWRLLDLDVGVAVIERTKTHRARAVPLAPAVVAMLQRRKEAAADPSPEGRVFTRASGAAIDSGHAASKFLIVARKLDLRTEGGGRPTLHSFRHAVASHALRAGYADAEVRMLLGHSRGSSATAGYLHSTAERLRGMMTAAAEAKEHRPRLKKVGGGGSK